MYILLAVVVFVPLYWSTLSMPLPIMPEVQSAYNTVQDLPKGKIAWVFDTWGPGTAAENQFQMEAIVRHLFKRGIPFILIPFDVQGTKYAEQAVVDIAKSMGKKEGVDWISLGFRPLLILQISKGSQQDMNGTLKNDRRGIPLTKIPMTKGKTINDVGVIVETTPSATVAAWIAYLGQPKRIPIIYCPTSVMVPDGYNFVDSKQVAGMLPGLVGAAQYDKLVDEKGYTKLFSYRGANALSAAHALIILLIILANIGFFVSRRQARQE